MLESELEQVLDVAFEHIEADQLNEARVILEQVHSQQPAHPRGLHLLGIVAYRAGAHRDAIDLIRQCLAFEPHNADAKIDLGLALYAAKEVIDALAAFETAIALDPAQVDAHFHLGNLLATQGRHEPAIAAYRTAIALDPDFAEAHAAMGDSLLRVGRFDECVAVYRHALSLMPELAEASCNLGYALERQGRLDQAIAAYHHAIKQRPDFAVAYNNLGNALKDQRRFDEAIAAYSRAIELSPDLPLAHSNRGNALRDKGDLDGAMHSYRRAITIDSRLPEPHNNLGNALRDAGRLDEAMAEYREAIAVDSSYAVGHSNLIYAMHFHPRFGVADLAVEQRRWNRLHAEPLLKERRPHANDRHPDRPLRVGYVSADFREHAAAFFVIPLLDHHDPEHVEVFCYANVLRPDGITRQMQTRPVKWRNIVGLSDADLAERIRDDRIDILVDLMLHTANNRLGAFARKPAPLQVTWLGYPGSTGLTAIDYRLSDSHLDPPGMNDAHYSEKTICLPSTYWCYSPLALDGEPIHAPVNPLPALKHGSVTFGCFSQFSKITPETLSAWCKLLDAVPRARLRLSALDGDHRRRTLEFFTRHGIDANRVEFVGPVNLSLYFRLHHEIDIALDPMPNAGGTTTCHALWMGVPVVTLAGEKAITRGGASILANVGLPELIARSDDDYVRIASSLSQDLTRLSGLRATLRNQMQSSPLMDAARFTGDIESAYRQVWRTWCEG